MGVLYLAQHKHLDFDRERVVKVLHADLFQSPQASERFRREVQWTAALSKQNEHIVRVYDDFGQEPGLGHYYVMEYLEGQPLTSLLNGPKPLADSISFPIVYQVCKALALVHNKKLIHRDLKPDNIYLVQREDNDQFVKLIDFGIAKSEHTEGLTHPTQGAIGTPMYMSPEQCEAQPLDKRSDIYSLGMIVYQMLTQKNPYGLSFQPSKQLPTIAVFTSHLIREPEPLTKWRPDLPKALSATLERSLAKSPDERFSDVESFWKAITLSLEGYIQLPTLERSPHIERYTPSQELSLSPTAAVEMDFKEKESAVGTPRYPIQLQESVLLQPEPSPTKQELRDATTLFKTILWASIIILTMGATFAFRYVGNKTKTSARQPAPKQSYTKKTTKFPSTRSHPKQAMPKAKPSPSHPKVLVISQLQPSKKTATIPTERPSVQTRDRLNRNTGPVPLRLKTKRHRQPLTFQRSRAQHSLKQTRKRVHPPKKGTNAARTHTELLRKKCGQSKPLHRWVLARLAHPKRRSARVKLLRCPSCRVVQRRGEYCLLIPKKRSTVQVWVSVAGYQACLHALKKRQLWLSWSLRLESPDSLAEEGYSCVKTQ